MSNSEAHNEAISRSMKLVWQRRKDAKAKAERKAKRNAKKLATAQLPSDHIATTARQIKRVIADGLTGKLASGVKVKLPKGTQIKDGKVKPPSPNIGRTKPQQYAAKTKKTYRGVK